MAAFNRAERASEATFLGPVSRRAKGVKPILDTSTNTRSRGAVWFL